MIFIQTSRHGLLAIAATVNDHLIITAVLGLTQEHARRRLMRRLNRVEARAAAAKAGAPR